MKVNLLRVSDKAIIPTKNHEKDFCYNLTAISEEEISSNIWKYKFGWKFKIERKSEILEREIYNSWCNTKCTRVLKEINFYDSDISLAISLKSLPSIWKHGMLLANGEIIINENCTDEISAVFYHIMPSMPRYKIGDIVCQMNIATAFPIEFKDCKQL